MSCGVILLTLFINFVLCLSCIAQPGVSDGAGSSLSTSLKELESAAGIQRTEPASMLDRVAALEQKAFGKTGTGSIADRVQALHQAFTLKAGVQQAREAPVATITDLSMMYPLANVSPPRFVRIPPVNTPRAGGDYFAEVMKASNNRVLRFNQMPIPVYITPYPEKGFTESCIKGFEAWEEQSRGLVRFTQVSSPDEARIRVVWSHLGMAQGVNDCTLGAHTITKWKAKSPGTVLSLPVVPLPLYIPNKGPKYSVPPQVIEVNLDLMLSKHPEVRYQIIQNVVTHELGHALGLLGHSTAKGDMMYPLTDEHSRLSPRDISTIRHVYQMKADIPL